MFLSDASLRRPVAMSCLIIGLALLGMNAYRKMGLEMMPKVDVPYITIMTVYPGASPAQIETDIAKRIEDQVVAIDGLKHVSSSCMENVCQTMLEFHLEVDVDIVATDVREKLDLIAHDLPEEAENPKILKYDINAKPIINLALTGDAPIDELYDYADNTLRDRLTVISGVANVDLVGGAKREVQVLLDRNALAARGLSSMEVVQAIQGEVRKIPSGRVRENGREYTVEFDADFATVADIAELEVANRQGQRIYLKDVGRVVMATEELRQGAAIDGRTCVAIKVVKKSDANAVRVVERVKEAMAGLNRTLPGGMELVWVSDDAAFTEALASSAWLNVGQGILLTAAILFLFLYNLRSLFVIAVTMPLTIVIGLFFMQWVGFTLNSSTLIAIGMSIGILVTNSIVVLEAIVKRLDETGDPKEAARMGSREAAVAVIASAVTNIVVLFPIAVMGGMIGLWIKPFALTMLIMTAVSLFVSFTLTPILCSLLLKPQVEGSRSLLARMARGWNWGFERVTGGYKALLLFSERHRWAAILLLSVVLVLFLHSLMLAGKLGSTMASESDRGELILKLEFPTDYDLDKTRGRVQVAETLLRDLPELRHILSTVGKVEGVIGQSNEGVYLAQLLLKFSERDRRTTTIDELMAMVRGRLADFADSIVTVSMPAFIGGQGYDVEMDIAGEDFGTLDRLALKAKELAGQIPGFSGADTTVRAGKPKLRIQPRRPVLADLGIPAASLGFALRANIEGLDAGTYRKGDRNYNIVVKFEEEPGKAQVGQFLFPGAPGHPMMLTNLSDIEETEAPVRITRKDKQRVSRLYGTLDSAKPLGTAVNELNAALDEKAEFPPGYAYRYGGMYEFMSEGQTELAEAGLIAIVLVILTLAAVLESFRQPVTILVTLPLAVIGMIWALALAGMSIEIFVLMGGVMLIGIVVNNAILIMDQFNVHIAEGVPRHKAMISAACERLRPITMITIAAVLGMLPLAFGRGIGAEMRNAIGVASAGGILISGILTMLVMPVLYDLFTRRSKNRPTSSPETATSPVPPNQPPS